MDNVAQEAYRVLMNKEIYAILDGDTKFGEYEFKDTLTYVNISMPYLSGPDLCSLSSLFGLPVTYVFGGVNLSRWVYLNDLFEHCIKTKRCSELLSYMFDKQRFSKILRGHETAVTNDSYFTFVQTILNKINDVLYFCEKKLVKDNQHFLIKTIGTNVEVVTPRLKNIDREYVKGLPVRALKDIDNKDYDSAITKSRTLLEETFCYVIEKKNEKPTTSGNIKDLYKQVKNLYDMHDNANIDRMINTLLSGLEKIVSSVSEIRNKDSDSHGVGANRIDIEEHHARLILNAAMIMADFILSVEIKENNM